MNYEDIKTQVDAGDSAATIAKTLAASTLHVRNCMAVDFDTKTDDLAGVLERHDLLDGSLQAGVDSIGSAELSAAWEKLKRHMQTVNRVIHSGDVAAIGGLATTLTNIAKSVKPSAATEIQSDMDGLTGGLKFAGVLATSIRKY